MSKVIIGWLVATVVACAMASPALALEKYLCVADLSTGFKGSNWVIANFKAYKKYIVHEFEERDEPIGKVNYEIVKLGKDFPRYCSARSNAKFIIVEDYGGKIGDYIDDLDRFVEVDPMRGTT